VVTRLIATVGFLLTVAFTGFCTAEWWPSALLFAGLWLIALAVVRRANETKAVSSAHSGPTAR
jgi:hypothetical protein